MAGDPHDSVPGPVLAAYGFAPDARTDVVAGGLINRTYTVQRDRDAAPSVVIQRLHPIFAAQVNIDIDVITGHLAGAGLATPRLRRTRSGERWVAVAPAEGSGAGSSPEIWRALDYIPGTTLHNLDSTGTELACSAGALVGRFHCALADLEHEYAFERAGVHDTAAHLARLRAAVSAGEDESEGEGDASADRTLLEQARALGREILAMADTLPRLGSLPRRHSHGDLKISNVLFAPDGTAAHCLIDLDTLGWQTIAYELGDAMRSWCNPHGEDVAEPEADEGLFAAAMAGYRSTARDLLDRDERAAIVPGWETVCVELAARFCVDVFADSYFGWNSSRYPSRRAHNLARARGQLALARSVRQKRGSFTRLV